jgi:hypothetical protein
VTESARAKATIETRVFMGFLRYALYLGAWRMFLDGVCSEARRGPVRGRRAQAKRAPTEADAPSLPLISLRFAQRQHVVILSQPLFLNVTVIPRRRRPLLLFRGLLIPAPPP